MAAWPWECGRPTAFGLDDAASGYSFVFLALPTRVAPAAAFSVFRLP